MVRYRIRLQHFSDANKEGTVYEHIVASGEKVEVDQPVMEVDSDKVTFEISSFVAGSVVHSTKVNDAVQVEDILFYVDAVVNFEVGDKVRCVDTMVLSDSEIAPPLVLNQEYEVKGIVLDKKGNQHINVGLESKYNYIRSLETGEELPDGDKIHWCHPSRLIKL